MSGASELRLEPRPSPDREKLAQTLARALERVRGRTLAIVEGLDDAALHVQHAPIMSPIVWDLGHIGNFEALWLLRKLGWNFSAGADLDRIYDPFRNPRARRADLPLLDRASALSYLAAVRAEVRRCLAGQSFSEDHPLLAQGFVYHMILQHEAQHQETILQSLDLRARPCGIALAAPPYAAPATVDDEARVRIAPGPASLGVDDCTRSYDNERPRHLVELPAFSLDRYPVTCRRYRRFIDDGGYQRSELWSPGGWAWRCENDVTAPQGWRRGGSSGWEVNRFGTLLALDEREPVQHVCWHEAQAFARYAGGRLPSEAEWEKAAAWDPVARCARTFPWGEQEPDPRLANLDQQRGGPAPVGTYPHGASAYGVEQLVGDVYEWTASPFGGYPGFEAFPYREYSEVFFGEDYRVLRGSSWATSSLCARASFRNWDFPVRRQIFAGFRLAWDESG